MKERLIAPVERALKSTARVAENAIVKRPYLLAAVPATGLALVGLGAGLVIGDPAITRVSTVTLIFDLAVGGVVLVVDEVKSKQSQ